MQAKRRRQGRNNALPGGGPEATRIPLPVIPLQSPEGIRGNCHVKTYPDGSCSILAADRAIFRVPGYEAVDDWGGPKVPTESEIKAAWMDFLCPPTEAVEKSAYANMRALEQEEARRADNLARAKRRAKAAVTDLALSNDFRFFVTLTLDKRKIDRYDIKAITMRLNTWLDNHVRRDGLKYVLVPERHKDGAVHFHGFFNDALEAVDSGHKDPGGHVVYNLPAWDFGFTTAIELYGDKRSAVGYVSKYVNKAQEKIGGRWYYSGGDLAKPAVTVCQVDYDKFAAMEGAYNFEIKDLAKMAKIDQ